MTTLRANFITGTVQESPLTSGATTLTMAGALQATPTVAAPNIVRLIIDPLGADVLAGSAREIIHVTAYTQGAGSATIARGQEGTTGVVHSHGMTIGFNSTKADWDEVIALTATHEALTTGVHGVGASTVDSVAARTSAISTHAGLSSGVHGVSGTIASTADIAAHNQTTGVHGVGGGTIDSVGGRDAAILVETNIRAAAVSAEASIRASADSAEASTRAAAVSAEASIRASADSAEASTRATNDLKRARFIGVENPIIGSGPALSVDFQVIVGRQALTTSGGGQIHWNFPTTFPNGLLAVFLENGNAGANSTMVLQPGLCSTHDAYALVFDPAGNAVGVGGVEIVYMAVGW